MKVSAPTAPVPDPQAPEVDSATPTADLPPVESTGPATPAMARWPEWFKPIDIALAILAMVLAFLLASYTARNSDIWRHMGTGRLIAHGNYPIGGDPLSYTGSDAHRAWVNSNWVFDLLMYLTFSADDSGVTSVVLKALVFAAAFGLLFLLRKPDQALWPWALMSTVGIVASGSLASMRPGVFGVLLQSIVLVLIYRGNWTGPKWRMPAILGGISWVWACTDVFFFLGPLTILLILLGEKVQAKFKPNEQEPSPGQDPFWTAPPVAMLQRALLLSAVGVLMNPMFLGALARSPSDAVSQLVPFELTFGWDDVLAADTHLAPICQSPLNNTYREKTQLGNNASGYAALTLLIVGGIILGSGYARLRPTHLLLWVTFAALAILHFRFIPYACAMAVPLAAAHLNGFSRFRLQGIYDPTTKMILNLSGIGRILTVTGLLFLIAATIPGKLHGRIAATQAYNRRVSWGIEEDVGLSRSAKMIEQWRASGALSPDSRGLVSFTDFGDYCAWFAPREKVFINSRYRFHSPELVKLALIRDELRKKPEESDSQFVVSNGPLRKIADEYRADYFVLGQWSAIVPGLQMSRIILEFDDLRSGSPTALLHLDGRIAILCRTSTDSGRLAAGKIAFSPGREAFRLDTPAVPSGASEAALLAPDGWLAEYLATLRAQPGSIGADDALVFAALGDDATLIGNRKWMMLRQRAGIAGIGGGAAVQTYFDPGPRLPTEEELAYPVLANRAARRAIVETKDDPAPYLALAAMYGLRYYGIINEDAQTQRLTSFRRFLDRVPVNPNGTEQFEAKALDVELSLFQMHYEAGQLDLAVDALTRANTKIKSSPDESLPTPQRVEKVGEMYRQRVLELQYQLPPRQLDYLQDRSDLGYAREIARMYVQAMVEAGNPMPTEQQGMQLIQKTLSEVAPTNLDPSEKADKPKPRDAAWVKARCQTLEDRVKREVGRRNEAFTQGTKIGGLAVKFLAAVTLGFTDRAIDMILNQTEWEKVPASSFDIPWPSQSRGEAQTRAEYERRYNLLWRTSNIVNLKDGSTVLRTSGLSLNLYAISLLFQSGNLDKAAQQLTNVNDVFKKEELEKPDDPRWADGRAAIKELRTVQARLEGNYKLLSEDLRERLQTMPKFDPASLERLKTPFVDFRLGLAAVTSLHLAERHQIRDPEAKNRAALSEEATLQYELAMVALQAGDNKLARERFEMALKPQGISFEYLIFNRNDHIPFYSQQYLRLLVKYSGEKPAK